MDNTSSMDEQLKNLELSLLQDDVRKSEQFHEMLADEFVEFGSSGRTFTKAEIIASLQAGSPTEITATRVKVQWLAPHVGLVTYRAERHTQPPVVTLRSSIWVFRDGRWQMMFHQGTLSAPEDRNPHHRSKR